MSPASRSLRVGQMETRLIPRCAADWIELVCVERRLQWVYQSALRRHRTIGRNRRGARDVKAKEFTPCTAAIGLYCSFHGNIV